MLMRLAKSGKLYFKVHFDAKGFAPDNIKVNSTENRLVVHAKKVSESDSSTQSREFCRMIELPRTIDHNQLKCRLTEDGVLMLEAPVKAPDYESITFTDNRQLGIHPKSANQIQSIPSSKILALKGVSGPTILDDGANGKRLHLEVPVDPVYKPEDLCVNVDSNRVVVSGKIHKTDSSHSNKRSTSSYAEFTHSYEIPETVDPLLVAAQLFDNRLVLEAPLVTRHTVSH
uniref:Major egg antigen (P40) n=1 Tax=Schistosoma japonicum TaxID=6182 RepID=C1LHV1_SCHJA|nr:Major egg antigen (p40) [Schistosoma japonicum]